MKRHMLVRRKIKGDTDVLLFPSVESHSITSQFLMHTSWYLANHILVGASVPIIITGRVDDLESHVYSITIGSILCEFLKTIKYYTGLSLFKID